MKQSRSVLTLLAPIIPRPETHQEWRFLKEATLILVEEHGEVWVREHRKALLREWEMVKEFGVPTTPPPK